MAREISQSDSQHGILPSGAPAWVTEELIAHTIRVWQKYSVTEITPDDALEILLNTSNLLDVLGRC